MAGKYLVPDAGSVRPVMQMLFGEQAKVKDAPAAPAAGPVASFVDDGGVAVAVAQCDAAFGAYAGAALSLIPPAGAAEAVASGALTEGMAANLHEVMNICSSLFMDDGTAHLKLDRVYGDGAAAPEPVQALLRAGSGPSLSVEIPRYGAGVLRLCVA